MRVVSFQCDACGRSSNREILPLPTRRHIDYSERVKQLGGFFDQSQLPYGWTEESVPYKGQVIYKQHGNVPLVDKCSICREHDAKSTPRRYLEGEERIPKRVRDLTE